MIRASKKRKAVAEAFGDIPIDSENLNWLFRRRHLAKIRDGRSRRELRYVVDYFELERVISQRLEEIRQRDGAKIFREVAGRLVDSIGIDVEIAQGKRDHLR